MNMISHIAVVCCGMIWSCTTMTSHVTVFTFGLGNFPPFFKPTNPWIHGEVVQDFWGVGWLVARHVFVESYLWR